MWKELLQMPAEAWVGWKRYTEAGKLIVPVLAVLVCFGLFYQLKGHKGRFIRYGIVSVLLCVCPLTAAMFMVYQTRFYDYQWIWSMVPVTALIAFGGTYLWNAYWQKSQSGGNRVLGLVVTMVSVVVLMLCGGGGKDGGTTAGKEDRMHAQTVLAQVSTLCGENICLWAPADILEYARTDGSMQVFYGRNMWDAALNAYSYDTCPAEHEALYDWMEQLDDWDIEISCEEIIGRLQEAHDLGADCILFPTGVSEWFEGSDSEEALLEQLAECGATVWCIEGYYLVKMSWDGGNIG